VGFVFGYLAKSARMGQPISVMTTESGESEKLDGLPTRSIGRSIGAILAGFIAVVILSIGTDIALRGIGIFPRQEQIMSNGLFLLATVYRTVYGVIGSYITARLAPNRPMQHALAGGVIGFALSIAGTAASWNHVPSLGPHWYPLALVVLALPGAWVGGKIYDLQRRAPDPVG
jgi:drug/metabolite transporter (DMT)-like permease